MSQFVNISTYRFTPLPELKTLRNRLTDFCADHRLKGTILLAPEGINLFVAGEEADIDAIVAYLERVPGLENLNPKRSVSGHQPFTRMLIKNKQEIIAFGVPGIDPAKHTSRRLPARELKQWLDEKKDVVLLDTRNDYEIRLGTFRNAQKLPITHFRDFPAAVAAMPEELKNKTVVSFCTGGIRCEKAGPYLESVGFKDVYQLDGGILRYFEEVGSDHYDGDCFVFDQRVGVDPSLQETPDAQCFACLTPLSPEEQKDPRFVMGRSCPYCFKTPEQSFAATLEKRYAAIREATTPLPGREPYRNLRPAIVPAKYEGRTIGDFLKEVLHHISAEEWDAMFTANRIVDKNERPVTKDHPVKAGDRYFHIQELASEPDISCDIKICYEDEAIIVIEKPAPLPVHSGGRFHRNTLVAILDKVYAPQRPRPAHRLDASTTGILVIARTKHFAGKLQPQFERQVVDKVYLARVWGHPTEDRFECHIPISEGTRDFGSHYGMEGGLPATTLFEVKERYPDGTSLLEVKPLTGRTNQIRVHLWELGFPIYGDPTYLKNKQLGKALSRDIEDKPLCLHAHRITFNHPLSGDRVTFQTERTPDFR